MLFVEEYQIFSCFTLRNCLKIKYFYAFARK